MQSSIITYIRASLGNFRAFPQVIVKPIYCTIITLLVLILLLILLEAGLMYYGLYIDDTMISVINDSFDYVPRGSILAVSVMFNLSNYTFFKVTNSFFVSLIALLVNKQMHGRLSWLELYKISVPSIIFASLVKFILDRFIPIPDLFIVVIYYAIVVYWLVGAIKAIKQVRWISSQ